MLGSHSHPNSNSDSERYDAEGNSKKYPALPFTSRFWYCCCDGCLVPERVSRSVWLFFGPIKASLWRTTVATELRIIMRYDLTPRLNSYNITKRITYLRGIRAAVYL